MSSLLKLLLELHRQIASSALEVLVAETLLNLIVSVAIVIVVIVSVVIVVVILEIKIVVVVMVVILEIKTVTSLVLLGEEEVTVVKREKTAGTEKRKKSHLIALLRKKTGLAAVKIFVIPLEMAAMMKPGVERRDKREMRNGEAAKKELLLLLLLKSLVKVLHQTVCVVV
jgi:hypothetical protein